MRGFDDKGRIYDKWEPSAWYIPQKVLALFLTCIGEGLVIAGIFGIFFLGYYVDNITKSQMSLILGIVFVIPMIIGLVCLMIIPNTIYYMVMWWLTKDSYYINMYNEKT
ncbi:MAG: hypothetical protein R2685_10690 [Candidatus Nitrosocosmicus sp.]|nr:hypothetical protein [Candidatus Nitrosocosmicus sp.]